jgi:hypothetical protein
VAGYRAEASQNMVLKSFFIAPSGDQMQYRLTGERHHTMTSVLLITSMNHGKNDFMEILF